MTTPHKHADNSANKRTPHVHAELIKAWADGHSIEWRRDWGAFPTAWCNIDVPGFPGWNCQTIAIRVKPIPKPDVVLYTSASANPLWRLREHRGPVYLRADTMPGVEDDCMFIFDGETGKLKDVQLLATLTAKDN